jgi:Flp pilus assembly pilin Flp
MSLAMMARNYIQNLFTQEDGQDVFEYLLIIAGISVVIIAAGAIAVPGLFGDVVDGLCTAINGMDGSGGIQIADCTDVGSTT